MSFSVAAACPEPTDAATEASAVSAAGSGRRAGSAAPGPHCAANGSRCSQHA